jgi:uncharacterized membrane protein
MLVVVFDKEAKAYEGRKALHQLDEEGGIAVYAYAVIAKNADGSATVKQTDDQGPFGTLTGTALGSLIGLFGGPTGLAIGAAVGLLGGSFADIDNTRIGEDFVDDVAKELLPGKFALVAEIEEDWTTPVDERMEALGGKIFRRALSQVKQTVNKEDVAAMKDDLAQLKAEHAKARADRQAKLKESIDRLDAKIKAHLEKAKARRVAARNQAKAKIELLKTKMKTKAAETQA